MNKTFYDMLCNALLTVLTAVFSIGIKTSTRFLRIIKFTAAMVLPGSIYQLIFIISVSFWVISWLIVELYSWMEEWMLGSKFLPFHHCSTTSRHQSLVSGCCWTKFTDLSGDRHILWRHPDVSTIFRNIS